MDLKLLEFFTHKTFDNIKRKIERCFESVDAMMNALYLGQRDTDKHVWLIMEKLGILSNKPSTTEHETQTGEKETLKRGEISPSPFRWTKRRDSSW